MAAQFRVQVNTEGFIRFQILAAIWSAIAATNQTLITAGAKSKAAAGCLYSRELSRLVRYADQSANAKAVDRLRFVAKYWSRLDRAAQVEIVEHAQRVAELSTDTIPLAAIASNVERVSITPRGRKTKILNGSNATQWAIDHGQLLGTIRAEYSGWCANFVEGLGAVMVAGLNIVDNASAR